MNLQKEALFKKLIEKTKTLGRKVTFVEFDQDDNLPKANSFAYYYGSFDVAAQEAWDKVRFEHEPRAECGVNEMEVSSMSKKKQLQMDEERKERVIDEFVKMYIERDGEMPSTRMIKKNPYITEEEVNALRMCGELTEPKVRRRAEKQSGKKFLTPEERRTQKMKMRYGCSTPNEAVQTHNASKVVLVPETTTETKKAEPVVVREVAETKTEVSKMRREWRGRGHGVSREDVLRDLKALTERLGHLPTQAEVQNVGNGAQYSYTTYVKKLGPKSGWAELIDSDDDKVEVAAEVAEAVAEEVAAETEDTIEAESGSEAVSVDATEMRIIEFPVKVMIPKGIKGTVTVTMELV